VRLQEGLLLRRGALRRLPNRRGMPVVFQSAIQVAGAQQHIADVVVAPCEPIEGVRVLAARSKFLVGG